MAEMSVFKEVSLHSKSNNYKHSTSDISFEELIVRRGKPFNLTLTLAQPLRPDESVVITAMTGNNPSETSGTMSIFGIPSNVDRSPRAKAVWKMELDKSTDLQSGTLGMIITPPADAPIGKYKMIVKKRDQETAFASLVLLFNPWCPDDVVFLRNEKMLKEYVMNEEGKVYYGSHNYISSMDWNFGQFEDSIMKICMELLDNSIKHKADAAADVAARSDPIYVGRVISAMINSQDDLGVIMGNWSGDYSRGIAPTHWTGSPTILKKWFNSGCKPVKYGQCWVFASVMCTVMRLFGIPTRVVTNFSSAHDTNRNLTIDRFCDKDGFEIPMGGDSIWNFHVWVESWIKRADLAKDGKYDGWQVLDPTPQEESSGIYCCGPASVKAIKKGEVATNYDVPFVFAEVNADCIEWEITPDGSHRKLNSDTKKVGRCISTKAVGSKKRKDITHRYKHREGSDKERFVFVYACTRDYTVEDEDEDEASDNEEEEEDEDSGETEDDTDTEEIQAEKPPMSIEFEEVTIPTNGQAVSLRLMLRSKSTAAIQLNIKISVQAMRYNDYPAARIQTNTKEETLQPFTELSIPILVPFAAYHEHMVNCDTMKIAVLVEDIHNPDNTYFAEDDVVLRDPPLEITVSGSARVNYVSSGKLVFMNKFDEILKNCTLTFSGNGLLKDDFDCRIPDLKKNTRLTVMFNFIPYKPGHKTLVVVFDSATLKDVKSRCKVNVLPQVI